MGFGFFIHIQQPLSITHTSGSPTSSLPRLAKDSVAMQLIARLPALLSLGLQKARPPGSAGQPEAPSIGEEAVASTNGHSGAYCWRITSGAIRW